MEINNNKSIRGIFLYADDIKFERGDFVVEGDKIYVTKADSIGRKPSDPENSDYFQIYLKEKVADLEGEDFIDYLKGKGQDKLISAYTVGKLLSMYLTGFDEKGTITNEITEGGSIVLKDYFGNETVSSHTNPLDVILTTPSLNNAIFKVDRAVVESLIGSSSSSTSHYVLLRQYTYSESAASTSADSIYTRVQELIDEETGIVKYRYSRSSNSYEPSTDWISVNTNSEFTSTVDDVINYYSNKCIELDKQKAVLRDSFRFKNIYGSSSTGTNTLVMYTSENPISNESFAFFTICTLYAEDSPSSSASGGNSRIYRADSITVDLLPFYKKSYSTGEKRYGIVGGEYIDITSNVNLGTITFTTSGNSLISNIYMRESLKDVDDSVVGNIHISHKLEYIKDSDSGVCTIPFAINTTLTANKNVSLLITTKLIKQTAIKGPFSFIVWAPSYIPSTGKYVSKEVTLSVSLDDIPEVNNLEDKSSYLIVTSTVNEPSSKPDTEGDIIFFTARVGLCKYQENIYVEPFEKDLNIPQVNKSNGYYVIPANIHATLGEDNFLRLLQGRGSLASMPPISIDSIKSVINE